MLQSLEQFILYIGVDPGPEQILGRQRHALMTN